MTAALASAAPESLALARSIARDLERLKDLQRVDPAGAQLLWQSLADHVRSAQPMLLVQPPRPLAAVKTPVGDGFVGLVRDGARMTMIITEASGRDAAVRMTLVQAESHVKDVLAVIAGGA
jgi:hypothetical protein